MDPTYSMAIVTAPGRIEFQERRLPDIRDDSVLVRIRAASICGSDLHILRGKHPGASLPVALGHEGAGDVEKVGRRVSSVREGDRVAIEPVICCGECLACRGGHYNYCADLSRPYRKGQGTFSPYIVMPEQWVHKLPPGVSYAHGALVEPLAVAVHAVKRAHVGLGHTTAIFGAGPIGLLVLQVARLAGSGWAFVVDLSDFRLGKAGTLGASRTVNALREEPTEVIRAATNGRGVDRAFEAVGREQTLVRAIEVLKRGGTAVVLGIFENPEARIPVNMIQSREVTLAGSRGYCWDFQDAVALLERGAVKLGELVTHVMPITQLQQALELLLDPKSEAVKVVIEVG